MPNGNIRSAINDAVAYLTEHPEEARYTDSAARAVLEEGLRIKVEGPAGEVVATDMPTSVGGTDSAPSPGWLFRAALASCEATLIAMRAAHQGVALTRLEVSVDGESDDRGILGIDPNVPPGPLAIAVRVMARAGDGADRLPEVVEWGHAHCPVQEVLGRAVPVSLETDVG
jgi:uncharacterized OsmC-like protein